MKFAACLRRPPKRRKKAWLEGETMPHGAIGDKRGLAPIGTSGSLVEQLFFQCVTGQIGVVFQA